MQPPLSPLSQTIRSSQTLARRTSASGALAATPPLPTSPPHPPIPRTWMGSQHEAVREAFPSRSEPIDPSRSEPIKTHVWLIVPAAALIPFFLPPAPSSTAPGVGGTLIRARALRHHMSPRRLSVLLWPVATSVTTATAVVGGANRSDSPPSLLLSIQTRKA